MFCQFANISMSRVLQSLNRGWRYPEFSSHSCGEALPWLSLSTFTFCTPGTCSICRYHLDAIVPENESNPAKPERQYPHLVDVQHCSYMVCHAHYYFPCQEMMPRPRTKHLSIQGHLYAGPRGGPPTGLLLRCRMLVPHLQREASLISTRCCLGGQRGTPITR